MAEIQLLQRPPSKDEAEGKTIALLNARIPTWNVLLGSGEFDEWTRQSSQEASELDTQLRDSTQNLNEERARAIETIQTTISSAQDAALSRHILADDLQALSSELVSSNEHGISQPTLLEDLEALHRKLKELRSVHQYTSVIQKALSLSAAAIEEFQSAAPGDPISSSSLTKYTELQKFVQSVASLCGENDASSEGSVGLLSFLESIRDRTWTDIKSILLEKLVAAAEKLKWPNKIEWSSLPTEDRHYFVDAFTRLLKLQEIAETLHPAFVETEESKGKNGIYALQALVQPIAARFKYHFEGPRETNRLDKPEWYFTNIINVIHQHREFMNNNIQRLLNASHYKQINAHREFTRLLFPMLGRKIRKSMPELLQDTALLAQTIYQSVAFDTQVRDDGFALTGTYLALNKAAGQVEEWEGVSEVILGRKEWFDSWLEAERRFAEAQYDELVHSPNAWQLVDDGALTDEDSETTIDLRPTNSARRIKALFEQISDRYKPLPRFNHRARFLIAIQIPILEHYHTRISGSLDAFETLSSTLLRAVPGALAGQVGHQYDTRRLTSGVDGLQRLIKAFVSARWITIAMQGWGEKLFYLELWKEINERASLRAKAAEHNSLPTPIPENVEEGALFDELIAQYDTLTARSEDLIVHHVISEVQDALRVHIASSWTSETGDEAVLPSTLLSPVTALQQQLAFLATTLPASSVTILYRRICSSVASFLVDRMIFQHSRGKLEPNEAPVLAAEYKLWIECSKQAVGRMVRKLEIPWQRLREASTAMNLDHDAFRSLTNAAWEATPENYEKVAEEYGVSSFSQRDARSLLRLRTDCTR